MNPTIEAKVDEEGVIRPKEPIALPPGSRLLITVLSIPATGEGALLSEEALAADWNRPEEDQAWATLAQA
jgi:predicted DNA-binding antitoxin AbrB/MazE fold protein